MSKPSFFWLASSLSAAVAMSPPALANADNPENIYVSATRSETAQLPVATQIKVITREEIRVSGAKLVSEVLQTQAGIQLSDADGSGMRSVSVSMRGLAGANNVLVLVDGRKLNNPSIASPALNAIAVRDIERIEIVQGSAGVLYGDQAVGGVINIITRRAAAGEIRGAVSAKIGSDKLRDYGVNLGQGFANGLSYNLSLQKRDADNYRDNNNSAYDSQLLNLRYAHKRGYVFVEGQSIDDELRTPGSLSDAQAAQNPRQTNTPNDYSNQYTDLLRLGAGQTLTDNLQLLLEYSDRDEEGEYFYDDYFYGSNPAPTHYSMQVTSLTPRLIGTYATAQGQAIVTLGYDRVDSDYESDNIYSTVNSSQLQESVYGQLIYPLLPKLIANLGVRQSQVKDNNRLLDERQDDKLTASEFGLSYQLSGGWRLFGRYAESFRFANPDDNNRVAEDLVFLKPQTGESWELGAQWQGDAIQLSSAFYRLELNDEIVFDAINFININLPASERRGLTLDMEVRPLDSMVVRMNYTYTDAEAIEGAYAGNAVPFVAENTGSMVLVYEPMDTLSFSLETLYTGSRFKADDEANIGPKLANYSVVNLTAGYSLGQLELSFRANNISDERYAGFHSVWGQYPQPERNYTLGASIRF